VESGVSGAINGISNEITARLGSEIGQAAAQPIADAVASSIPEQSQGDGATLVQTGFNAINDGGGALVNGGMAEGGPIRGGIPGLDSVPILAMPGEHMLTTDEVQAMGGHSAVYAWRRALRNGQIKGFATGGGVNVNDTVGAEFFGVSQVPILGAIVNLLVRVLLQVLGVNIEARDTLDEMSGDFRDFRGDFQAFDAQGRLLNDTSGLTDRSSTSEETAAAERIRILKIVLEALIKYLIEKVIVPISKAIANSVIQAGAGAASGAIGASFPGGSIVGNAVGSVITSAGSASVDIIAEIATDFALAISDVAIEAIFEGLQSLLPGLINGLFSGAGLELFAGPLSQGLGGLLALPFSLFGAMGTISGPSLSFDSGGTAYGVGYLPKSTIEPEHVLSPRETSALQAYLRAGARGGSTDNSKSVDVGGIHLHGSQATPEGISRKLLELL
jgi:hypothetical protein